MTRGPKQRTSENSRKGTVGIVRHDTLEPPSVLSEAARVEYERLVAVLKAKGTLDRVDLVCISECARIKVLLDSAQQDAAKGIDWDKAKLVAILSGQHRGRLRELGLTTQPCRSAVRANPIGSERDRSPSPWDGKLKVR
jgi:phage terminase small subunit